MKRKKLISFSVEISIIQKFNDYCNKKSINKSLLIENYIKYLLENDNATK